MLDDSVLEALAAIVIVVVRVKKLVQPSSCAMTIAMLDMNNNQSSQYVLIPLLKYSNKADPNYFHLSDIVKFQ